jgi:alkyl sulfatase BDS1-like metallo-beta-lactamase superfamily hydrolase
VRVIAQHTPDMEALAEMNTCFPQFKACWAAENVTATIHDICTRRAALIRDPMQWSKEIGHALLLGGREAEAMLSAHSCHGSERHNSLALISRYLGHRDGNPATLVPLSPIDCALRYVEMMGGSAKVLVKGRELVAAGRCLLADAFEQPGYQQESSSLIEMSNATLTSIPGCQAPDPDWRSPSTGPTSRQ